MLSANMKLDLIAAVLLVALAMVVMRFLPGGVALALTIMAMFLWIGWRERRSDKAAARAWLFDHGIALAGAWAIAWSLVLVIPGPLAVIAGLIAAVVWMAWRKQRAERLAAA